LFQHSVNRLAWARAGAACAEAGVARKSEVQCMR